MLIFNLAVKLDYTGGYLLDPFVAKAARGCRVTRLGDKGRHREVGGFVTRNETVHVTSISYEQGLSLDTNISISKFYLTLMFLLNKAVLYSKASK